MIPRVWVVASGRPRMCCWSEYSPIYVSVSVQMRSPPVPLHCVHVISRSHLTDKLQEYREALQRRLSSRWLCKECSRNTALPEKVCFSPVCLRAFNNDKETEGGRESERTVERCNKSKLVTHQAQWKRVHWVRWSRNTRWWMSHETDGNRWL